MFLGHPGASGTSKWQECVVESVAVTTLSCCICRISDLFVDSEPWARFNLQKVNECWWFGDVGQ